MNTDRLLGMLLEAIDYSFLQIDGSYDKTLTYPVIDKVQYIKEQVKNMEVKEVDLEKYYHEFLQKEWFGNSHVRTISEMMAFTAKHFFELGMVVSNKAQKEE